MWYYQPKPEDPKDLRLKRLLDEQYLKTPFYGVLRMTEWLKRLKETVNVKRVRRLLREMGLEALYPKRNLSKPAPGHKIYPYLLKGLAILRPNQVWSTDITYIRLKQGFVYLVAVIDWHSRYVLSWGLSVTMESNFCVEALDQAIRLYGVPDIFNTDQGSQFTCTAFTNLLIAVGAQISMDGRGRALDNVFVERLWRSVKYEEVFLHDYVTVEEAMEGLKRYFEFYNTECCISRWITRRHKKYTKDTKQEASEPYAQPDRSSRRKCVRWKPKTEFKKSSRGPLVFMHVHIARCQRRAFFPVGHKRKAHGVGHLKPPGRYFLW